jgi:tRNA(adenine34) deaminase
MQTNKEFMDRAIEIAEESAKNEDYAIGAVIVKDNKIIASGKTELRHKNDPTVHAEIVAIRSACQELKSRYLEECILYSTCEPCPMCSSAAVWAKMKGIIFGSYGEDAKRMSNAKFSWRQMDISCKEVLSRGTPRLEVTEGFLREECNKLFSLSK